MNDFQRKALQNHFRHIEGLEIVFEPRSKTEEFDTVWTTYKGMKRVSGYESSDIEYLKRAVAMDIQIIDKYCENFAKAKKKRS